MRNFGNAYAYAGHNYGTYQLTCENGKPRDKEELKKKIKEKNKGGQGKYRRRTPPDKGPGSGPGADCKALAAKIINVCREIWKRRRDLREDPLDLRWRKPSSENRCDRKWHFDELKRQIRQKKMLKAKFIRECGGRPPGEPEPIPLPAPEPRPAPKPDPKPDPKPEPELPPVDGPRPIPIPSLPRIPCPEPEDVATGVAVGGTVIVTVIVVSRIIRCAPPLLPLQLLPF